MSLTDGIRADAQTPASDGAGGSAVPGAGVLEALAQTVDAVVAADRMVNAAMGVRTELIERFRALNEVHDSLYASGGRSAAWQSSWTLRSTVAQLACALRIPEQIMTALVGEAEVLVRDLPETMEALGAGTISYRHASVMAEQTRGLSREATACCERELLGRAGRLTVSKFRTAARRWRQRHHPVELSTRHRAAVAERRVEFHCAEDGMAWLSALLPAAHAQAIDHRLSDMAVALRAMDDKLTREGHQREERTLPQRRADILTDLLLDDTPSPQAPAAADSTVTDGGAPGADDVSAGGAPGTDRSDSRSRPSGDRQGSDPPPSDLPPSEPGPSDLPPSDAQRSGLPPSLRGIRATVAVTVPVLTLLGLSEEPGDLAGYGPIDPDTARELAANAPSFIRILTHPETGAVLSIGRDRYTVPADLRTWLTLRDETCRHAGCNHRASRCDADHTTPWSQGGATSHDNLTLLCPGHHQLKHHESPNGADWAYQQLDDGALACRAPTGHVYVSEPALQIAASAVSSAGTTTPGARRAGATERPRRRPDHDGNAAPASPAGHRSRRGARRRSSTPSEVIGPPPF